MAADSEPGASGRPVPAGRAVTIRPGGASDAARPHAILAEPSVAQWWGEPDRGYTRVGFRPVGVMRQYERGPDGRFRDGLLMDLLRSELTAGRAGLNSD